MNLRSISILSALALGLTSCADFMEVRTIRPKRKKAEPREPLPGVGESPLQKRKQGDGIQVGKAADAGGFLPDQVGGDVKIQGFTLPSDDSIVWSDEDNYKADIAFDKPFLKPMKNKGGWGISYSEARRESIRSGKPIVMWFINSATPSTSGKKLSDELFSISEFKKWAANEIVRLRIDLDGGSKLGNEQGDEVTRKRQYLNRLKKQYRVLGYPTVVVLNPAGEVVEQYRGYSRGQKNYYWDRLKDRVLTVKHNQKIWRKRMKRKGYREWTGKNGRVIFAKLTRYSGGSLILVEPNGRKSRTNEAQLSQVDRAWLEQQKAKRR